MIFCVRIQKHHFYSLERLLMSQCLKKPGKLFIVFMVVSLVLHGLVFLLLFSLDFIQKEPKDHLVFVNYPLQKRVVAQESFNKLKPKMDSPFLSRQDKSVDKQTQALLQGLFHQALNKQGAVKSADSGKQRTLAFVQKAEMVDFQSATEDLSKKIKAPLKLSFDELNSDLSRTPDFLPEVELGSHTLLNTNEFAYYSFFVRMKEQLYWHWLKYFKKDKPFSLISMARQKQRLFSTSLYVFLSPDGEIQDLRVVNSSGSEIADTAATHAFLSSAPFPNPPKGLVEADGYIHIRQGFNIYVSPAVVKNPSMAYSGGL